MAPHHLSALPAAQVCNANTGVPFCACQLARVVPQIAPPKIGDPRPLWARVPGFCIIFPHGPLAGVDENGNAVSIGMRRLYERAKANNAAGHIRID